MKKKALMAITAVGLMAFAACDNKSTAAENVSDSTAVATEVAAEEVPVTEAALSLPDIVAKAKAEGANWSADEWKEQIKQALIAYKPYAVATADLIKKIEDGNAAGLDLEQETKKVEQQYPGYDKLIRELTEVAAKTANGKGVVKDQAWIDNTMKELGVPHN